MRSSPFSGGALLSAGCQPSSTGPGRSATRSDRAVNRAGAAMVLTGQRHVLPLNPRNRKLRPDKGVRLPATLSKRVARSVRIGFLRQCEGAAVSQRLPEHCVGRALYSNETRVRVSRLLAELHRGVRPCCKSFLSLSISRWLIPSHPIRCIPAASCRRRATPAISPGNRL
jgi:hypothetical protein